MPLREEDLNPSSHASTPPTPDTGIAFGFEPRTTLMPWRALPGTPQHAMIAVRPIGCRRKAWRGITAARRSWAGSGRAG